ncbi:MAG TPA: CopG family transcriptional regulator [Polyangia bacterium]|nr:CopG family transcriptional regulator [Polyangia bacterium]
MSKRLQVILDDEEMAEIQRVAQRNRMTSSEWVRQALRKARSAEPHGDVRKKLGLVRRATEHAFPTADIDDMLAEIERGYLNEPTP